MRVLMGLRLGAIKGKIVLRGRLGKGEKKRAVRVLGSFVLVVGGRVVCFGMVGGGRIGRGRFQRR
jgi:hypothetical protein